MKRFLEIIAKNRAGEGGGIYSVCTAQRMVLEAAFQQGIQDQSLVLVEATANQVNQYGGYTGMQPADFPQYIEEIAASVGFSRENIILGGDHLGPTCWVDEPAELAMQKARELVDAYVVAGFTKIHLDASMPCMGDPKEMTDTLVAARAADLCEVAEQAAMRTFGESNVVYVVGTEVPAPGGETEAIAGLQVTSTEAVKETLIAHQEAFAARGLEHVWSRVIGLVVQPGVEFDHTSIHDFEPEKTNQLGALIDQIPNIVFEAHSTDYQRGSAYAALIERHFAILKVGPQLTFALREALFALSYVEDEIFEEQERSDLRAVCERVMLEEPGYWQKYYPDGELRGRVFRRYSYSDRIRYYWTHPEVESAVEVLKNNLGSVDIPLPVLSLHMPIQYNAVRAKRLSTVPGDLIRHHIMQVTGLYAAACKSN